MGGEITHELWDRGIRCPGSGVVFFREAPDGKGVCPRCSITITVVSGCLDDHVCLPEYIDGCDKDPEWQCLRKRGHYGYCMTEPTPESLWFSDRAFALTCHDNDKVAELDGVEPKEYREK